MDQKYIDKVKQHVPDLFVEVSSPERIDEMTKQEMIHEIVRYHPAQGVEIGYSWYIGGMPDTGEWLPDKMKWMDEGRMREFLKEITLEKKESNRRNIQTLAEWYMIEDLPEPERTMERDRRSKANHKKQMDNLKKLHEDMGNYLMWGKQPKNQ